MMPEAGRVQTSVNTRVPVLQLIYYTSGTPKICPNRLASVLTLYIGAYIHYDCGICICVFEHCHDVYLYGKS